ncbi:zinc ribbon domain-containing protein [Tardisphaera saccharovorans]
MQLVRRKAKLVKIGRFDASSKARSRSGSVKHDLALSDRVFRCDACGLTMDHGLNAAISILNMDFIKVGRGTPESTPAETPLAEYLQREGISYASLN